MEGNGLIPRKYTKMFGHSRAWYLAGWLEGTQNKHSWVQNCSLALWVVVHQEIYIWQILFNLHWKTTCFPVGKLCLNEKLNQIKNKHSKKKWAFKKKSTMFRCVSHCSGCVNLPVISLIIFSATWIIVNICQLIEGHDFHYCILCLIWDLADGKVIVFTERNKGWS